MPGHLEFLGIGILSWVTWLPLVGALILIFAIRRDNENGIRYFANTWILLCFLISLPLLVKYDRAIAGIQFIENYQWIPIIGARYQLGIDGISLALVILTTLLGVLAVLCSWSYIQTRLKEFYAFLLMLQTGMIGTFVAMDMFLFYVFWEVMLVPMYFLIGVWGGKNRLYSAIKFFLYTLVGSVVMLLAILKLYFMFYSPEYLQNPQIASAVRVAAQTISGANQPMLDMINQAIDAGTKGQGSFNIMAFQALGTARGASGMSVIPLALQIWLFVGFGLGFAIKVPMFPFHTWLPDAHYDAPTAGSVILAGVLLKMGTYGFLRFNLPMFPDASQHRTVVAVMVVLSIIGIIYGALVAMAQKDIKKLIAYSSVSHLGFCMLGMFALNPNGLNGSILQQINHGISTGALFLLAGMIYERRHTYEIADFGGLAHKTPGYAAAFLIITLSSIGLPMLNGFIGEFLILRGAFEANRIWAAFGALGIVLGAAYMLWLYQRVFFGKIDKKENEEVMDLNRREWAVLIPLIILAFWIGIYPKPVLSYFEKPVQLLSHQVRPNVYRSPGQPEPERRAENKQQESSEKKSEDVAQK